MNTLQPATPNSFCVASHRGHAHLNAFLTWTHPADRRAASAAWKHVLWLAGRQLWELLDQPSKQWSTEDEFWAWVKSVATPGTAPERLAIEVERSGLIRLTLEAPLDATPEQWAQWMMDLRETTEDSTQRWPLWNTGTAA